MPRGRGPVEHGLGELFDRHAGMRHGDDLQKTVLAGRRQRLLVASSSALNGCLRLPFRMLRRHRLDAVEREGNLEVIRLLGPQRAVIVEGGDALGRPARNRRHLAW